MIGFILSVCHSWCGLPNAILNVGIVASYAITANGIRWGGLPHDEAVFDGHRVGRLFLLGFIDSFWVTVYRALSFFPRTFKARCSSPVLHRAQIFRHA